MNIDLQHIQKRFGRVHANHDISVSFRGGRVIGVLGENGAGKSTLMKILSGYQAPDSGTILIDGVPIAYHNPLAAIAAGIGMLQQDPLDVPAFSVLENFVYGQPPNVSQRMARLRLETMCEQFGFDLDPEAPSSRLSIGQRQQLEILRLLAMGVKALILDEPTTGISAQQKTLLFNALKKLARDEGMLILLVSHKLEDVLALCDEVVVLRGGKLVGSLQMPTTTGELVKLMFGQPLEAQPRPNTQMGNVVYELDRVEVRDKRVHIHNFSLRVRAGEVIGLAGMDGSGQELLMRAGIGITRTLSGRVRVRGRDLTHRHYRVFMQAGAVFGAAGRLEEGLVAGLTLTDHMALVASDEAWIDRAAARKHTQAGIERYNVRGRPDDPIEALSGGNQQRVLMALLPPQPTLLMLEQPTRGLDVESARWVWEQLLARRAGGTAIIFASPDLDELLAYSDRIIVFFAGRVCEISDARSVTVDRVGELIGGNFESVGV
jgi:general nucleoside transport system ATP-binding protein